MRELDLTTSEAIDYAAFNAAIIGPAGRHINPYLVGLRIWEEIERKGGTDLLFEVRECETDVSFLRNHLSEQTAADLTPGLSVTQFVQSRMNGGHPCIVISAGDGQQPGHLHMQHRYDGVELDARHLEKTLAHVHSLWGAPVHIETVRNERAIRYSYDGILFEVTEIC
jgi:stage V sporulation protein R